METTVSHGTTCSHFLFSPAIAAVLGFFQAGFDSLQRRHAFAFQITLARARQDWLGKKTMLHPKSLLDGFFQKFIFNRSHDANLANHLLNRKSKTGELLVSISHIE